MDKPLSVGPSLESWDVLSTLVFSGLTLYFGWLLAKRFGVPFTPFAAIFAAMSLIAVLMQIPESPFSVVQLDGVLYLRWGQQLASLISTGTPVSITPHPVWPGSGVWSLIIGLLTIVLGPIVLFPVILNAALIATSSLIFQKVLQLLTGAQPKWTIVVLVISNPAILLNGPSLLRESLFWFGGAILTLAMTAVYLRKPGRGGLLLVAGAIIILGIRPNLGIFVVFAFGMASIFLWAYREGRDNWKSQILALLMALLLSAGTLLSLPTLTGRANLAQYSSQAGAELASVANSGFSSWDKVNQAGNAPAGSPESPSLTLLRNVSKNLTPFMFGPFWWEVQLEPIWIYSLLSTWHYWFVLCGALVGMIHSREAKPVFAAIFLVATFLTLVMAATLTNYGIVTRFRSLIELLLLPGAASGFIALKQRSNRDPRRP